MGYRNDLYVVDKKKFNKIRKKKKTALIKLLGGKSDIEDGYLSSWDLKKHIDAENCFELGKYIDFYDQIKHHLKPAFKNQEVHEYLNEECEFMLADFGILQELASIYKEKVVKNYKDLLEEESLNPFDRSTKTERVEHHVRHKIRWCEYLDELPEAKYKLVDSWTYEHEAFNLLYLMKVIDPSKQYLLWTGG